jgi:hypothetical protein
MIILADFSNIDLEIISEDKFLYFKDYVFPQALKSMTQKIRCKPFSIITPNKN